MRRLLIGLVLTMFLAGCATAKNVGWGKPYEVLMESDQQIVIEYDSLLYTYKRVFGMIQQYADEKYTKNAVFVREGPSRAGGWIITLVFELKEKS